MPSLSIALVDYIRSDCFWKSYLIIVAFSDWTPLEIFISLTRLLVIADVSSLFFVTGNNTNQTPKVVGKYFVILYIVFQEIVVQKRKFEIIFFFFFSAPFRPFNSRCMHSWHVHRRFCLLSHTKKEETWCFTSSNSKQRSFHAPFKQEQSYSLDEFLSKYTLCLLYLL